MSILVPNSFFILNTLPESCYLCRFKHNGCGLLEKYKEEHDGCIPPFHYMDRHLWNPEDKGRVHGCPLKEIQPHGRLIDADLAYDCIAEVEHAGNYVDMDAVGKGLENTPTVVEAEDGE